MKLYMKTQIKRPYLNDAVLLSENVHWSCVGCTSILFIKRFVGELLLKNMYYFQTHDYCRVGEALNTFPTMSQMTGFTAASLRKQMDSSDVLAYPLLQWCVSLLLWTIIKLIVFVITWF